MARVRTAAQAAAWIDRVGLALVFPKADVVLPSIWEAVKGDRAVVWSLRDPDGGFVSFTREMEIVWAVKDELPERRLACVGKHLGGVATCIAPRVLPSLYALTGRAGEPEDFRGVSDGLELAVAEAVLSLGPLTGPALRRELGSGKKDVDRAVLRLQRALVLTNAGLVDQDHGWGAIAVDLVARRFDLSALPGEEDARRSLVQLVLASAGEVTAADVAGALGWRRRAAETVLEDVAEGREAGGFRIWTAL